jgi:hypothetical protein
MGFDWSDVQSAFQTAATAYSDYERGKTLRATAPVAPASPLASMFGGQTGTLLLIGVGLLLASAFVSRR